MPIIIPDETTFTGWIATADAIFRDELKRPPALHLDPAGLASMLQIAANGGTAEDMIVAVRESAEWHAIHDAKPIERAAVAAHQLEGAFCIPTHPSRVWWPAFLAVDDTEQDRYIAETVARGYTFGLVLVSGTPYGTDYPAIAPDHDRLRAGLQKIRAAGLLTIVAFDDSRGADLSYLEPVLAGNEDLIDWCMGIFEINGVLKSADAVLSVLKQSRELLPNAKLAVHFTPLDEGSESYGLVDFHRAHDEADLNALFFQSAAWDFAQADVIARVQDFTRRLMAGMNGYPILSDGVYVFELTTSLTYRFKISETEAIAITDAVMNAPLWNDGAWQAVRPSGFCDGGTLSKGKP